MKLSYNFFSIRRETGTGAAVNSEAATWGEHGLPHQRRRSLVRNDSCSVFRPMVFMTAPLCPVAVPEILRSLFARRISTAATPFCSLFPPPAALAKVPASGSLRAGGIIHDAAGFCKSAAEVFRFFKEGFSGFARRDRPAGAFPLLVDSRSRKGYSTGEDRRREVPRWTNTSCSVIWRRSRAPS